MDIVIKGDKVRAKEFLRNIWSYVGVENITLDMCNLSDGDLDVVERSISSVKFLSMRGNVFVSPWSNISKCFPNVVLLDLRDNAYLMLNGNVGGTLGLGVKELFSDIKDVNVKTLMGVCPEINYYNNVAITKLKTSRAPLLKADRSKIGRNDTTRTLVDSDLSASDDKDTEVEEDDEEDAYDTVEEETIVEEGEGVADDFSKEDELLLFC